jgi:hypothetical protein
MGPSPGQAPPRSELRATTPGLGPAVAPIVRRAVRPEPAPRAPAPRAAAPGVRHPFLAWIFGATAPQFMAKDQLGAGSRLLDDLLLPPLLKTRDLLSLAATATWLRPYRNHLGDIKIKAWHDDVTPAMMRGQRHLRTLHVGSVEVLGRLAVSLRGEGAASPGSTLRRLILEWEEEPVFKPGTWSGVQELGMWLRRGCPLLEEMDMSRARLSGFQTMSLFFNLQQGCPELRCLKPPTGSTAALAAMLEQGWCPKIQQLTVSCVYFHSRLAEVLRAFPSPALRDLHLISSNVGPDFGDALRSGACPGLRVLRLESPVFEEGPSSMALAKALGEGACPDLTVLSLQATSLGPQGARALTQAMRAGGLARLQQLRLARTRFTSEEAVALGEALGEGACPDLTVLLLNDTGLGPQGAQAMAQAMRAGGLVRLEELRLSKNPILDEGVVALAEALGEGACLNLREIYLYGVGMENAGHLALARAMSVGGLPSLKRSEIRGNQLWDDLA